MSKLKLGRREFLGASITAGSLTAAQMAFGETPVRLCRERLVLTMYEDRPPACIIYTYQCRICPLNMKTSETTVDKLPLNKCSDPLPTPGCETVNKPDVFPNRISPSLKTSGVRVGMATNDASECDEVAQVKYMIGSVLTYAHVYIFRFGPTYRNGIGFPVNTPAAPQNYELVFATVPNPLEKLCMVTMNMSNEVFPVFIQE